MVIKAPDRMCKRSDRGLVSKKNLDDDHFDEDDDVIDPNYNPATDGSESKI